MNFDYLAPVERGRRHLIDAEADLKDACREAVENGCTKMRVAEAAGITRPTLDAWLKKRKEQP